MQLSFARRGTYVPQPDKNFVVDILTGDLREPWYHECSLSALRFRWGCQSVKATRVGRWFEFSRCSEDPSKRISCSAETCTAAAWGLLWMMALGLLHLVLARLWPTGCVFRTLRSEDPNPWNSPHMPGQASVLPAVQDPFLAAPSQNTRMPGFLRNPDRNPVQWKSSQPTLRHACKVAHGRELQSMAP